jgi:hypothetical protein
MLDTLARRLVLPVNAKAEVVRPRRNNGRCPSVSVIIPCYNYGRYLTQCVNSVLDQQDVRLEVIVIDDASSDGSDQIVRQLGARDTRIRTICHTTNQGHIGTYNEGISLVTGDYTVLLSADDVLTSGCLARATALMEEYPSVGLTYGFPIEFTDGELPAARTTVKNWIIWQGHDWLWQRCNIGGNALKSPEAVVRTSVLREVGGYQIDLPHAADFALWMRAAAISDVGYVAGADQGYYRKHASNMHHSTFDMLDDFSQRLASFDTVFSECSGLLKDPGSMRDTAHRALARNALNQAIRDTAHRALARSAFGHAIRQHLRGTVGGESVGDYAAFALKTWPDAKHLGEWRTLTRLTSMVDSPPKLGPSLLTRMAVRKLRSRFWEWRSRRVGM